jgi:hypothetical protein
MPETIVDAAKRGKLVVFAGAGISTENSTVFPSSFYQDVRAELELDPNDDISFPSLMTQFEEKFGRRALIGEIVKRLAYVDTFPSLVRLSTRFHKELATMTPITTVVTTNWDTAFEDHCRARPFVVDDDYAYYDLPGRKVFKIHGSVNNVSTIVATEEDYEQRESTYANSALGSTLKHILATQTVVFIGFSLSDPDFQAVYRALLKGLGRARPAAYFVSPYSSETAAEFGVRPIQTDGTNFLRALKLRLVEDRVLLDDSVLERSQTLKAAAEQAQESIFEHEWRTHPVFVFSISYLDGIQDCTGRARQLASGGEYTYRHHLIHMAHRYENLLEVAVERERWWDASYIRGYLNAIMSFLMDDATLATLDLVECFDSWQYDLDDDDDEDDDDDDDDNESSGTDELSDLFRELNFNEMIERFDASPILKKNSIHQAAKKLTAKLPDGMILRHTPFLNGVIDPQNTTPAL